MKLKNAMTTALGIVLMTVPGIASADDAQVKNLAYFYTDTQIREWIGDPGIVAALRAANAAHTNLSQADIDALDQQWRAGDATLLASVMDSGISKTLKGLCDGPSGIVTEMILMDNKGLNVGQCGPSSDYWQGDEAKYQKTFLEGANAIFVDEIEKDESTGRDQLQTSISIADPDTGEVIGALTVGLDAGFLLQE